MKRITNSAFTCDITKLAPNNRKYHEQVSQRFQKNSEGLFSKQFSERLGEEIKNKNIESLSLEDLMELAKQWGVPLFSDSFTFLVNYCPEAASLHLAFHYLMSGLAMDSTSTVVASCEVFRSFMLNVSEASTKQNDWFTLEKTPLFLGVSETMLGITQGFLEDKSKTKLIEAILRYNVHTYITDFCDVLTICVAIISNRVIYLSEGEEFVICYGKVDELEAELMIAKKDSLGIWSMDVDRSSKPLPIKILREAKRAIAQWRGNIKFYAPITHEYARKLSNYLGLVPMGEDNDVVTIPQPKPQGFAKKS